MTNMGRLKNWRCSRTCLKCPSVMPEGSMGAGILPGFPNLDWRSRDAVVGFGTRTFRSANWRYLGPLELKQGGSRVPKEPKPDVESTADFPTLDAAIRTEPAPSKVQSKAEREEEASWSQAGVPRKPTRTSEMLPIAVNPAPSSYVSPGLRKGGSSSLVTPRTESTFDNRPSRDEFSHRNESTFGSRRSEAFTSRDAPSNFSAVDGWSRGQTIVRDSTTPNRSSITTPISLPSRTTAISSGSTGGEGGGGWERGAAMKTFRDSDREKAQFELVQSNRFAGLSET
ncbi:hypothetical protein T265_00480 [Opisthorchis viverrini]|uniref:Uncharacterized protein n=1 Tax=Opisthorchis viverrini TaxID=6198 RepID=A0A075A281_OPIVI|nr:hypothetical protein T265_00480 [Opisthorchis viverrini]KER33823.1 hypothetical protein T265_00480 [Opisthorchis viverrini]